MRVAISTASLLAWVDDFRPDGVPRRPRSSTGRTAEPSAAPRPRDSRAARGARGRRPAGARSRRGPQTPRRRGPRLARDRRGTRGALVLVVRPRLSARVLPAHVLAQCGGDLLGRARHGVDRARERRGWLGARRLDPAPWRHAGRPDRAALGGVLP